MTVTGPVRPPSNVTLDQFVPHRGEYRNSAVAPAGPRPSRYQSLELRTVYAPDAHPESTGSVPSHNRRPGLRAQNVPERCGERAAPDGSGPMARPGPGPDGAPEPCPDPCPGPGPDPPPDPADAAGAAARTAAATAGTASVLRTVLHFLTGSSSPAGTRPFAGATTGMEAHVGDGGDGYTGSGDNAHQPVRPAAPRINP